MNGFIVWGAALAAAVAAVWTGGVYKRLTALGKKRDDAWNGVLAQLRRRRDLAPSLLAAVEGRVGRTNRALEEVERLCVRAVCGGPLEALEPEWAFSESLIRLMAVAEGYPDLRADRNFRERQNTLVRIEDDIQVSRGGYNGAVRDYNDAVSTFPGSLVARFLAFRESPFFELESPAEADTPTVSFNARGD